MQRYHFVLVGLLAVAGVLLFWWSQEMDLTPRWLPAPSQPPAERNLSENDDRLMEKVQAEFIQLYERLNGSFNVTSLPECNKKDMAPTCRAPCNASISTDPLVDLKKVINTQDPIPNKYYNVMEEMTNRVRGWYDVTVLTGSSSNHYEESQGLVKTLHQHIFPRLKKAGKSLLFIYYDLGLLPDQRKQLEAQCQCTVLDFPFKKFPDFVSYLKCYTWKPVIIYSHHQLSPVTFWFDAATRLYNASWDPFVDHVMTKGVGIFPYRHNLATYTAPPMMEYFGDPACRYSSYPHFHAGVIGFRNSPWVHHGLLTPWVACALSPRCMCPPGKWRTSKGLSLTGGSDFGQAHRYDQAALDLLLAKMFRVKSWDFQPPLPADTRREENVKYFT